MLRRIIKQGHSTLTVTLPSKWTKQFNLKAGDDVDVGERDNGLFISTERKDEVLKTEIDIIGLNIPTLWKFFMAAYREGYDEVKVTFDPGALYDSPYKFFSTHSIDAKYAKRAGKRTPFEAIQEIVSRFIGYEVIEHHQNYCIIREISQPSSKEFESSLRRVFLLLLQMGEEIMEAINTNNTEMIRHTHDIDINVDKFHDYCIRVLNKTRFMETKKNKLVFATLYTLELIGDEFKSIANHLINDLKGRDFKNIRPMADLVTRQINTFYKLYYGFSKDMIAEISQLDIETHFYLPKLYKKQPGRRSSLIDAELEIFNHFRRISKYINAATELRIEMEF